jgi:ABC-type dipeptide/oligopeptide/nickel transport system ATPase subunit|tara:strand:+ start:158 stop:526 length:369 start_codon:yes stop_codon:yes gene_type:complete
MIRELIITFDYHSGKTVKKLRKLELEKKEITDKERTQELKEEIQMLQQDYESKLKPVVLEIAFNIESQMQNMSDDEIFKKFQIKNADSSIIGDCVYNICQKLERQPSHKVILEMMPEKFRTN